MEQPIWFPIGWIKCTFPILKALGTLGEYDVCGSAFLLKYNDVEYAITAKHVLKDIENPMIGFNTEGRKLHQISSQKLKALGPEWIYHPKNSKLDLAAIRMPVELPFMDIQSVDEPFWNSTATINNGDDVLHLGYPDRIGASYADGRGGYFALAMTGKILQNNSDKILAKTKGHQGASGGPLFLRRKSGFPQLIGIAVIAKHIGGKYLDKTEFLPISNIIDILDSDRS